MRYMVTYALTYKKPQNTQVFKEIDRGFVTIDFLNEAAIRKLEKNICEQHGYTSVRALAFQPLAGSEEC